MTEFAQNLRTPTRSTSIIRHVTGKRALKALAYPSLLVGVAVVLTAFRISGTSVGMYVTQGSSVTAAQGDPALLAGTPRQFRWDEWAVNTPYIVAQSKLDYPRYSPSAVGGQDLAVIGAIPNRHWSTIFKPYNWPFFVLDLERAFAARWWLTALLLLIPAYALFALLTGRIAIAIAFSLGLFLSPFFHWWYLPVSMDSAGLAMGGLACLVAANRGRGVARWVLTAVSAFCLISFALLLYPPFQIPVAIVVGLVGAGWLVGEIRDSHSTWDRVRLIIMTAGVGLVTVAVLLAYYVDVAPTIAAITNTAYPGQRRVTGGGAPISQILGGPFDLWLAWSGSGVNQPEASSFLLTGLFVIPQVILLQRYRAIREVRRFLLPAAAAMLLLLAWALLPVPAIVGRITLLDMVPASRVIIGVGLAGYVISFMALAGGSKAEPRSWLEYAVGASMLVTAVAVAAIGGLALRAASPALGLRLSEIALGTLVFALLVGLVLTRQSAAAALALIVVGAAMSLPVNPVYRGLGPLESSPLATAAELGDPGGPGSGGGDVLSYLVGPANSMVVGSGRASLNAVNLYPNSSGWHALDPDGNYASAWNRYAATDFVYSPTMPAQIRATAPDAVVVAINPCDPGLDRLRVTTVISPQPLADRCLTELGQTRIAENVVAITYERAHG